MPLFQCLHDQCVAAACLIGTCPLVVQPLHLVKGQLLLILLVSDGTVNWDFSSILPAYLWHKTQHIQRSAEDLLKLLRIQQDTPAHRFCLHRQSSTAVVLLGNLYDHLSVAVIDILLLSYIYDHDAEHKKVSSNQLFVQVSCASRKWIYKYNKTYFCLTNLKHPYKKRLKQLYTKIETYGLSCPRH
jgi:hypothetical protein